MKDFYGLLEWCEVKIKGGEVEYNSINSEYHRIYLKTNFVKPRNEYSSVDEFFRDMKDACLVADTTLAKELE